MKFPRLLTKGKAEKTETAEFAREAVNKDVRNRGGMSRLGPHSIPTRNLRHVASRAGRSFVKCGPFWTFLRNHQFFQKS